MQLNLQRIRTHSIRILIWVVVLGIVVGSVSYFYFFLRLPSPGTGPAGPSVDETMFESMWSRQPTVLLGLGDSVTAGFGASQGKSYFERLGANPPDEFTEMTSICLGNVFPNLKLLNASVSGSNSIDCLERQLPGLKPFPSDTRGVVVITTGGNDLIHWYGKSEPRDGAMYGATFAQARPWVDAYAARLRRIIVETNALFPGGCDLFMANIYDPSDGLGKPESIGMSPWDDMVEILAAYNVAITTCAGQFDNVHLVDIHTPFLGHGVRAAQPWRDHYHSDDPHYWFHENIEDPNDRGYDALRRIFLNAMVDVFAGGNH